MSKPKISSITCVVIGAFILMSGQPIVAAPIDISGYFNWDTIVNDISETSLPVNGYRPESNNEYFVTEAGIASLVWGDGVDGDGSDIPNNGQITWGVHSFQMGTLTSTDFNTIMLDNDALSSQPDFVTIDIADGSYSQLAVLHASVALNTQDNGTVTVNYTTGDPDVVEWDNADWSAGKNELGMSQPVVGDLYGNPAVVDGMDFYRYQKGGNIIDAVIDTDEGRLYSQAFAVDPLRTVDSLTFTLPGNAEGDIGIYALSGSSEPLTPLGNGVPIAIHSSIFNQDTIVNDPSDDTSQGFRPGVKSEYFATEAGSAAISGGDGTNGDGTDIPNSGSLQAGLFPFEFGPLTEGTANTILMDNDGDEEVHASTADVDIANGSYDVVAVLYTGVASYAGQDGTMTVVYEDGSEVAYAWDLADWSGSGIGAGAKVALGAGLDFFRDTSGAIINTESGNLFYQYFDTDASKTIDSLRFALNADVNGSTDIGIYALAGIGEGAEELIPGDANGDGKVDGSDAAAMANNWLTLTGATWSMGDFNNDGAVDDIDATILATNWQSGVAQAAASVPEPSVLLLVIAGSVSVILFRSRRRC